MRSGLIMAWLVLDLSVGGGWLFDQGDNTLNMDVLAIKSSTRIINSGYLSPEYQASVLRYRADAYAAIGDQSRAIEDQKMARDWRRKAVLKVTSAAGPETR